MSRKIYAMLLPVLAIAAMAMTAGAAQAANPHWLPCKNEGASHKFVDSECLLKTGGNFEKKALTNGEANKIQVVSFGKLTFTASNGVTFTCKVLDAGNIWNLEAGGRDNIEVFFNYECSSSVCTTLTTEAKNLSWPTELLAGPVDKIGSATKEIEITVTCNGTPATFHGILEPKLANPTEKHPLQAEFTSTTGELVDGTVKAKVEGFDNLVGFTADESIFVE
jgi:hypothetical protein